MPRRGRKNVTCAVETTLRVIGGRWKVLVLRHLLEGTQRFNALQRRLDGISPRTLAKQLRELEAEGIVQRKIYGEIPPKVEYSLTAVGRSLEPVLHAMHEWGDEFDGRGVKATAVRAVR